MYAGGATVSTISCATIIIISTRFTKVLLIEVNSFAFSPNERLLHLGFAIGVQFRNDRIRTCNRVHFQSKCCILLMMHRLWHELLIPAVWELLPESLKAIAVSYALPSVADLEFGVCLVAACDATAPDRLS